MTVAVFNRDSKNLIDYVKNNEPDLFRATNIRSLNTKGLEADIGYKFSVFGFKQLLNAGYSYINDDIKHLSFEFSRYSINSLKHQFTTTFSSQFLKNLTQNVVYRYAEKTSGESYSVVDASAKLQLKDFEVSVTAQNIFNTAYTETNLIPMPKGNFLFELKYAFK